VQVEKLNLKIYPSSKQTDWFYVMNNVRIVENGNFDSLFNNKKNIFDNMINK